MSLFAMQHVDEVAPAQGCKMPLGALQTEVRSITSQTTHHVRLGTSCCEGWLERTWVQQASTDSGAPLTKSRSRLPWRQRTLIILRSRLNSNVLTCCDTRPHERGPYDSQVQVSLMYIAEHCLYPCWLCTMANLDALLRPQRGALRAAGEEPACFKFAT